MLGSEEPFVPPTVLTRRRLGTLVALVCLSATQLALVARAPAVAEDAKTRLRHTDPADKMPPEPVRASASAQESAASPACSASHTVGYQMIYARPSGVASRLASIQATLLADVAAAADHLVAESSLQGSWTPVRPRFFCGILDVEFPPTAVINNADPGPDIWAELDLLGHGQQNRKYVVWWDGPNHPNACGEGTFSDDERPSGALNNNNKGPDYATMYKPPGGTTNFCGWPTLLHEIGHTLGAVMVNAPNQTGGWHCTDENDILCYSDGPGVVTTTECNVTVPRFDCNNDDYFSPAPAPGTYLANNWNTYNSSWLETVAPPPGGIPDTTITQKPPPASNSTSATFAFTATVGGATFACELDGAPAASCTSPTTYTGLAAGQHVFEVTATTTDGTDPTPAAYTWEIDLSPPSVILTGPTDPLTPGRTIALTWSAADAEGSVASHTIRYRKASIYSGFGGHTTWKTQASAGAVFTGGGGWTYCFTVQVYDEANNGSGWSNERCATVPLDDRSMSVSSVTRSTGGSFYYGTVSVARVRGARLWMSSIRAKRLAVMVQMCSACRYVDVYWNGALIKKMSLYSAQSKLVTIPLATFGSVQTGTLSFVVNAPVVVVDGFHASQT